MDNFYPFDMPAGAWYDKTTPPSEDEYCRLETVQRLSGGVNLDDDKLPERSKVAHLAPLFVDLTVRKAKVVKNVRVFASVAAADTTIKVQKGSFAYVGMFLGTGTEGTTVSAIDKSNEDYDLLTITALGEAVEAGKVLFEASNAQGTTPLRTANFLNYAWGTTVLPGQSVTPIYGAFEVRESLLIQPVSEEDKETLTSRFMFVI